MAKNIYPYNCSAKSTKTHIDDKYFFKDIFAVSAWVAVTPHDFR